MEISTLLEEVTPSLSVARQETIKQQLATYLNDLLQHDFQTLVQLLYRVDVSEKKVKALLTEKPTEDAGNLLADLLIERQLEKAAARQNFSSPPPGTDEERW